MRVVHRLQLAESARGSKPITRVTANHNNINIGKIRSLCKCSNRIAVTEFKAVPIWVDASLAFIEWMMRIRTKKSIASSNALKGIGSAK
ncbi:hypothetical protein TNCV_2484781 [Trichonephila clavipes]|uniref:Uncharacterized protein n=1 Tax=Trichonephila clavipes TaxID=2585209 RepID=A0A8X6VZB7_TRICX|nr:hypothetical protein TNCV_2484781 [Trichonephila clavipes]